MRSLPCRIRLARLRWFLSKTTPHTFPPRHLCAGLPRCPVMQIVWRRWRPLLLMLLGRCCAARL